MKQCEGKCVCSGPCVLPAGHEGKHDCMLRREATSFAIVDRPPLRDVYCSFPGEEYDAYRILECFDPAWPWWSVNPAEEVRRIRFEPIAVASFNSDMTDRIPVLTLWIRRGALDCVREYIGNCCNEQAVGPLGNGPTR